MVTKSPDVSDELQFSCKTMNDVINFSCSRRLNWRRGIQAIILSCPDQFLDRVHEIFNKSYLDLVNESEGGNCHQEV